MTEIPYFRQLADFSKPVRYGQERGYDLRLVLGDGGHDPNHGGAVPMHSAGCCDANLSEPRHVVCRCARNGEGRNRTGDTTVFSRVLYQLSYLAARDSVAIRL
jgi:hypothetical protein